MSQYVAPVQEMKFVLKELADYDRVSRLPGYEEATPELADSVLEEAAKFAQNVLSPLNQPGDQEGAKWHDKKVTTAKGFKPAYLQFTENGWNSLALDPEFGGQGLPKLLSAAVSEMWKSANMAFALCPMLTQGAIEALRVAADQKMKEKYLPKMTSGEWTGTMNLTEPAAGSDLAAVRTRAEPQADGTFKVFGQKIFITYGDHDYTENVIHLVLARTPGAPEGVKGISLFVVPKFLINADGSIGARNDAYCVSIEHKLGIHASPTAVMAFGDNGGAIGYLVGEENRGIEYMFIMMNSARFAVGLEGVAIADRATQRAIRYAKDRIQGPELGVRGGPKVAIIKHPDVRRMLMVMKSQSEALRSLAYVVAAAQDIARKDADEGERAKAQAFSDLMTPVVKGWSTETGIQVATVGVQVHGGMGFIEETGAAQHLRDARITAIYEGTTAIQSNDLIGRKMARENGATMKTVIAEMRKTQAEVAALPGDDFAVIGRKLAAAIDALERAGDWIVANFSAQLKAVHAGSVPFLMLTGFVAGGWQLARASLVAHAKIGAGSTDPFYANKITTTRFYADHFLEHAAAMANEVTEGFGATLAMPEEGF